MRGTGLVQRCQRGTYRALLGSFTMPSVYSPTASLQPIVRVPRLRVQGLEPERLAGEEMFAQLPQWFGGASRVELFPASEAHRAGFLPAEVHTAFLHEDLWIWASMRDEAIGSAVSQLNECTCTMGDVFEIFLHPEMQDSYIELHVTPENHHFQVRFPSRDAMFRTDELGPFDKWLLWEDVFESWTRVEAGQWQVLARVPMHEFCDSEEVMDEILAGSGEVCFSYCRYDATPGQKPVLSSTSVHREVSFHRLHEWRRFRLER